ncbi:MAG: hypothetical protein GY795_43330, partial [Desulfobacterales bacterium]|nr:hypothetical protein [Desulfobacterales bacterium]
METLGTILSSCNTGLGAIGSICSILSLLPDSFSKEIKIQIRDWVSDLENKHRIIIREDSVWSVFFERKNLQYSNESHPCHKKLLEVLRNQNIPTKKEWLNAFCESWEERSDKDMIDFFKLPKEEATGYLEPLAEKLHLVYTQNQKFFQVWAYQKINTISQILMQQLEDDKNKESDINTIGAVACKISFIHAFETAVQLLSPLEIENKKDLFLQEFENGFDYFDFTGFRYSNAVESDFYKNMNTKLLDTCKTIDLENAVQRKLELETKQRFVTSLKELLVAPDSLDRFEPFRLKLDLDSSEMDQYDRLTEHHDYLRQLYEQEPVLGRQPFALSHVYLNTECGCLTWNEINKDNKDPFNAQNGGRYNLLDKVMEQVENPDYNDLIIIQGVAGSGKSSFTLHFARELIKRGLRPVRIRLKLFDFDKLGSDIYSALSQSIEPSEISRKEVLNSELFDEKIH